MNKLVALFVVISVVGFAGAAFAESPCLKCHKSIDKVAEYIKKTGAKSEAELVNFLRNKSAKKALHASLKDEDIKQAYATATSKTQIKAEEKGKEATSNKTKGETVKTKKKDKSTKATNATANATTKTEHTPAKPVKEEPKGEAPKPKKKIEGC